MNCTHEEFEASVNIQRYVNESGDMVFLADFNIHCKQCGLKFIVAGWRQTDTGAQFKLSEIAEKSLERSA